ALLLLLEALACMLLSVSYVLQLVKFAKQECPKKSGYLTLTDHFGAPGIDPQSLVVAFDGGREAIESLAEERIRLGMVPPFLLATKDF
ncbi:DUF1488 family protein, partial [Janthinobacterium sp. DSP2-3-3]|uniref:DUF1488 family protein n=1 Tax=Janthinobacterium sp. DSP2-3-3 TaxID=2804596 RepID=UPI003CE8CDF5